MLTLSDRENETHIEVSLAGALTLREVGDAWQHIEPLWQKQKILIVNLAGVTDLDTMGFQILLYLKIRAKGEGRKIHFVKHSTPVIAALDLFGAVAEFGDKIHLTPIDRARFGFKYGSTKLTTSGVKVH